MSVDNPYVVEIGGKHIHLLLLERGLRSWGTEVTTLYYMKKGINDFFWRCVSKPLPTHLKYKVRYRNMISYLERNVPPKDYDLVHAHDVLSLLAVCSRPQKKILTLHGYFARENIEFEHVEDKERAKLYEELLQFEKESLNYADYVITVDNRLKEYLVSEFRYPENQITVIHNAVDTDRFQPVSNNEQNKFKKDLRYDEKDFLILVPRRLVQKNGVIYAVKSMQNLEEENFRLVIAGDGPEKENIIEEAQKDRRIHLVGLIPHQNIDAYYKAADIVLIPSITSHDVQEASSLAMLEGMACGKTVVCSDIGGMREIMKNMENGILVKERDPLDIARAIQIAIQDPKLREAISNNARAEVVKDHSYLVHAKKTLDIYRSVLEGR